MGFSGFLKPKPDGGRKPMVGQQIITPGTTNKTINFGFHDGTGYVVGDADLIAANILAGKNIFGVTGAKGRSASGVVTSSSTTITFIDTNGANASVYYVQVTGLAFTPKRVYIYRNQPFGAGNYPSLDATYAPEMSYNGQFYVCKTFMNNINFRLDGTAAYVNYGGFRLPDEYSNNSQLWIAYED